MKIHINKYPRCVVCTGRLEKLTENNLKVWDHWGWDFFKKSYRTQDTKPFNHGNFLYFLIYVKWYIQSFYLFDFGILYLAKKSSETPYLHKLIARVAHFKLFHQLVMIHSFLILNLIVYKSFIFLVFSKNQLLESYESYQYKRKGGI